MTNALPLLAQSSSEIVSNSIFPILFFGFALAAIIWLILWLFFRADDADAGSESVAAPAEVQKSEAPVAAPAEEKSSVESGVEEAPAFSAASEEEAATTYAADIASGEVKQDATYGILYPTAPDSVDDLKKIKGVAKVLEGKLNSIGVYRFKQVAVWTDPACKEFSKLLPSFKDRIYRDNWIAQAKAFHEEKYGEKL